MPRTSKETIVKEQIRNCGIPESTIYAAYNRYFSAFNWTTKPVRQKDLGFCSRLMADMMANGATEDEFERAILFSIVVLDCIKQRLNTKTAYDDLGIFELKEKYMNK